MWRVRKERKFDALHCHLTQVVLQPPRSQQPPLMIYIAPSSMMMILPLEKVYFSVPERLFQNDDGDVCTLVAPLSHKAPGHKIRWRKLICCSRYICPAVCISVNLCLDVSNRRLRWSMWKRGFVDCADDDAATVRVFRSSWLGRRERKIKSGITNSHVWQGYKFFWVNGEEYF